jgi:hypothetical protein
MFRFCRFSLFVVVSIGPPGTFSFADEYMDPAAGGKITG